LQQLVSNEAQPTYSIVHYPTSIQPQIKQEVWLWPPPPPSVSPPAQLFKASDIDEKTICDFDYTIYLFFNLEDFLDFTNDNRDVTTCTTHP
jgi:hypothetical protein